LIVSECTIDQLIGMIFLFAVALLFAGQSPRAALTCHPIICISLFALHRTLNAPYSTPGVFLELFYSGSV